MSITGIAVRAVRVGVAGHTVPWATDQPRRGALEVALARHWVHAIVGNADLAALAIPSGSALHASLGCAVTDQGTRTLVRENAFAVDLNTLDTHMRIAAFIDGAISIGNTSDTGSI